MCPLTNQDGSQCRKRCIGVRCPQRARAFGTDTDCKSTGKAIQVYAGTYSTRTSRLLHPQIACHRGEFPVDDHYTTHAPATTPTDRGCACAKMYVGPLDIHVELLLRHRSGCKRSGSIVGTSRSRYRPTCHGQRCCRPRPTPPMGFRFCKYRQGADYGHRQDWAHLHARMFFQTRTTSARRQVLNYHHSVHSLAKTRCHHSKPRVRGSYYPLSYSHLAADTPPYRLSNDATNSNGLEKPPWAKMPARASTNAENLGSSPQRSSPDG